MPKRAVRSRKLKGGGLIAKLSKLSRKEVLGLVGAPRTVEKELRQFRRNASALSSSHPRLINEYPQRWVAVHKGKVKAKGKNLSALMQVVAKKRLPRGELVVRFIDREPQTMIL